MAASTYKRGEHRGSNIPTYPAAALRYPCICANSSKVGGPVRGEGKGSRGGSRHRKGSTAAGAEDGASVCHPNATASLPACVTKSRPHVARCCRLPLAAATVSSRPLPPLPCLSHHGRANAVPVFPYRKEPEAGSKHPTAPLMGARTRTATTLVSPVIGVWERRRPRCARSCPRRGRAAMASTGLSPQAERSPSDREESSTSPGCTNRVGRARWRDPWETSPAIAALPP